MTGTGGKGGTNVGLAVGLSVGLAVLFFAVLISIAAVIVWWCIKHNKRQPTLLTPHPVLTPLRLLRMYTPHNQFHTLCIVLFIQYSKSQLRATRHPLPSNLPTLKKLPLFPTLHLLLMMQPSVVTNHTHLR